MRAIFTSSIIALLVGILLGRSFSGAPATPMPASPPSAIDLAAIDNLRDDTAKLLNTTRQLLDRPNRQPSEDSTLDVTAKLTAIHEQLNALLSRGWRQPHQEAGPIPRDRPSDWHAINSFVALYNSPTSREQAKQQVLGKTPSEIVSMFGSPSEIVAKPDSNIGLRYASSASDWRVTFDLASDRIVKAWVKDLRQ